MMQTGGSSGAVLGELRRQHINTWAKEAKWWVVVGRLMNSYITTKLNMEEKMESQLYFR